MLEFLLSGIVLVLCPACEVREKPDAERQEICRVVEALRTLPEEARETSGIIISSSDAGTLWTHNDRNNEPYLYAVAEDGTLAGRVAVTNATLVDWEDIDRGACAEGTCLYIADIGDNGATREFITIYEVPEPAFDAAATAPARALHARYPDEPQDAESLFVTAAGEIHIITKGRHGAVLLYRVPEAAAGDTARLVRVRQLAEQPADRLDWVTGATLSPDGVWVVMRTYRTLYFFPADAFLSGSEVEPLRYDLSALGERQGEGVAAGADGTVWLTSEAEDVRDMPTRSRLMCTLPR